jgi:hypothetical protein
LREADATGRATKAGLVAKRSATKDPR